MIGDGVDMLFDIEILVNPGITLEFAEGVAGAVSLSAVPVIGTLAVVDDAILTENSLPNATTP